MKEISITILFFFHFIYKNRGYTVCRNRGLHMECVHKNPKKEYWYG